MRLLVYVVAYCSAALAIGCRQAADQTQGKASANGPASFVDQLSKKSDSPDDQQALWWQLTQTPSETRFQVLALLLSNGDDAATFNRQAAQITQCCVGLDKDLRSRVATEIIARYVEPPAEHPAQRTAVLLLAAELQLTRDYPDLAVMGMNSILKMSKKQERPAEWKSMCEAAGQWITELPADQLSAIVRELEWSAESNPEIASLSRRNSTRLAKRLLQLSLAAPEEGQSLGILFGELGQSIDADAASKAANRLLDIVEEHPEPSLQTALLKYVRKIPGGLSADHAKRAFEMTEPEFLESKSLVGVTEIVSNLSPRAVPVAVAELAKWDSWEMAAPGRPRSNGASPKIRQQLDIACEQADEQTAGEALVAYQTATEAMPYPSVMPFLLLVKKLPRESADEYRNRLAKFKNSDIVAYVARGLAVSEVALTSEERVEQIRFLVNEVPSQHRLHSARPLGDTLAATCQPLDDEHRRQAASVLVEALGSAKSDEAREAICLGLASLSASLTPEDADAAVQVVTRVASQSDYHDADRIVTQLRNIISDRPLDERTQFAGVVLKSMANCTAGSENPLAVMMTELAQQVPEAGVADLARLAVLEMMKCDPKSNLYDSRLASQGYVASELATRLAPADRNSVARLLAEQAVKALNRDDVKDEHKADRLAFRLVSVLGQFSDAIPPDAAEELLDTWLRVFVPPGDSFRGEIEIGLAAVANCVPVAAAPRFREQLRSMASDAPTALATRLRVVDACLPVDISQEEATALTGKIATGHKYEVASSLNQLKIAAPLIVDQLNDDQLLQLVENIASQYAKDPYFILVDSGDLLASLLDSVSEEASLRSAQLLLRSFAQMRNPKARDALTPGLKVAFGRLSHDNLSDVLDEILALSEARQNTAADAKRDSRKQKKTADFPESVVGQWFARLAAENEGQLISVLKSAAYRNRIQSLEELLPPEIREAAGIKKSASETQPVPGGLAGELMARARHFDSNPLELARVVELLKHPDCVGGLRSMLFQHLSVHTGRQYEHVWQFVDSAHEAGVSSTDLLRPPRRDAIKSP